MRTIAHQTAVIALATLVACASMRSYQPTAAMSVDEAKRVLQRTLEEQSPGFGATNIEVTDEKVTFARVESKYFGPIPTTSYGETTTFYFEGFGSAKISGRKRKGHVVWIYDKSAAPRFRVVVPTEENATRFVDAIYVLSLTSRSNAAGR